MQRTRIMPTELTQKECMIFLQVNCINAKKLGQRSSHGMGNEIFLFYYKVLRYTTMEHDGTPCILLLKGTDL